jgi:hypothetical protein
VQCSAATNHLITNAVLNISSDLMIISIPMPIFLTSKLPLRKKVILCGVFLIGLFTILSAVLNKYYSFTEPFGSAWTFWYIRESSTALITANLPFTWTLLQRVFNVTSFYEKYASHGRDGARSTGVYGHGTVGGTGGVSRVRRTRLGDGDDDVDMEAWGGTSSRSGVSAIGPDSSQEQINKPRPHHERGGSGGDDEARKNEPGPLEIYEQREIIITSEAAAAADDSTGDRHIRAPTAARTKSSRSVNRASASDVSTMGFVTTCRGV